MRTNGLKSVVPKLYIYDLVDASKDLLNRNNNNCQKNLYIIYLF